MSLSNLNELQKKIFGEKNQDIRNFSYKLQFFRLIYDIIQKDEISINKKIEILKTQKRNSELNNQPFDYKNIEVFYFYLYRLFINHIEQKIKNEGNYYLDNLKDYIISISNELNKYKPEEYKEEKYEEEKRDIKKFLTIFFSIINFDAENNITFSQITKAFLVLIDEKRNQMISIEYNQIKDIYGQNAAEKFKKLLEDEKIYNSLNSIDNIGYSKNKIEIPEECFSYD